MFKALCKCFLLTLLLMVIPSVAASAATPEGVEYLTNRGGQLSSILGAPPDRPAKIIYGYSYSANRLYCGSNEKWTAPHSVQYNAHNNNSSYTYGIPYNKCGWWEPLNTNVQSFRYQYNYKDGKLDKIDGAETLDDPECDRHEFQKWNNEPDLTKPLYTNNFRITATYKFIGWDIEWKYNGGKDADDESSKKVTLAPSTSLKDYSPEPTRPGYTLYQWNPSGSYSYYGYNNSYKPTAAASQSAHRDETYTAEWDYDYWHVRIDYGGGHILGDTPFVDDINPDDIIKDEATYCIIRIKKGAKFNTVFKEIPKPVNYWDRASDQLRYSPTINLTLETSIPPRHTTEAPSGTTVDHTYTYSWKSAYATFNGASAQGTWTGTGTYPGGWTGAASTGNSDYRIVSCNGPSSYSLYWSGVITRDTFVCYCPWDASLSGYRGKWKYPDGSYHDNREMKDGHYTYDDRWVSDSYNPNDCQHNSICPGAGKNHYCFQYKWDTIGGPSFSATIHPIWSVTDYGVYDSTSQSTNNYKYDEAINYNGDYHTGDVLLSCGFSIKSAAELIRFADYYGMSIVNVFDRNNNPATYRTAPVFSTNDTCYNTDNYGYFVDSYSIAHDTSRGSGH